MGGNIRLNIGTTLALTLEIFQGLPMPSER